MAEQSLLERCLWFDAEIRRGAYPNRNHLAEHFEISGKTAQRLIGYLRDRLDAPLEYDAARRGFYYRDADFALFRPKIAQQEFLALLLAQNLLAESAGGEISRAIRSFGNKLFSANLAGNCSAQQIATHFSASGHGYTPVAADIFRTVVEAVLNQRLLGFNYYVPSRDHWGERQVEPHHLQYYQGSWLLLAFCRQQQDWRKFLLGRMRTAQVMAQGFVLRPRADWQPLLADNFGVFQGAQTQEVVLRFAAYRARWVRDERWHPQQYHATEADGALLMRLPVSDFREIRQRILQYGADVEVLAPLELRNEVAAEILRMQALYAQAKK